MCGDLKWKAVNSGDRLGEEASPRAGIKAP